jgi:hypothetical protein
MRAWAHSWKALLTMPLGNDLANRMGKDGYFAKITKIVNPACRFAGSVAFLPLLVSYVSNGVSQHNFVFTNRN